MRDTPRSAFPHFCAVPTRWMDNDVYGHVNNVHYYSWFDTAVNRLLIERGVLDIHKGDVVGFVVETGCSYFAPVVFPDTVHVGVRVANRLGSIEKGKIANLVVTRGEIFDSSTKVEMTLVDGRKYVPAPETPPTGGRGRAGYRPEWRGAHPAIEYQANAALERVADAGRF